jgi:hypothetical protein
LTIGGNLTVTNGYLYGCLNGSTTLNITGNYIQPGGQFAFSKAEGTAYGNTSTVMNITGNAIITGGVFDLSQCDANNSAKGMGTINIRGNMSLSGSSSMTVTSAASRGLVNFNGTAEQLYTTVDNVTGLVDFNISAGAKLRLDQQIIKSSGFFNLNSTAGLIIGSADGITASAAIGNVQVTGTRTFSTGADYTYN